MPTFQTAEVERHPTPSVLLALEQEQSVPNIYDGFVLAMAKRRDAGRGAGTWPPSTDVQLAVGHECPPSFFSKWVACRLVTVAI